MIKKEKTCEFCTNQTDIDYKDVETLKRCLTAYKTITPRRRTGTCMWHQRKVSAAVKQARVMGLLPFISNHD